MTGITTITSTVTASFLASFVEVVEAFTIILAVGLARGWRPALTGTVLALLLLGALILVLGPLLGLIPLHLLQFVVGVMLSSFGVFWTGEGLGADWPGGDAALIAIAALFLAVSLLTVRLLRGAQPGRIEAASR